MKRIGIIGGVSPQSTEYLYSSIIRFSQNKYNIRAVSEYPNIILESLPIPDVISSDKNKDQIESMLLETVKHFELCNVDIIGIASSTLHAFLDDIKVQTKIPFISMVELAANKCESKKFKKVGLLATPTVIKSKVYNKAFDNKNIELIIPTEEDIDDIDRAVRGVIAGDYISEADKEYYSLIIKRMFSMGAQALMLSCIELPLTVNYSVLGERFIILDDLLAEAIVDEYYK